MKRLLATLLVALSLAPETGLAQAPPPAAQVDGIEVHRPWARATPARAMAGAAYVTLVNTGERPDRLVAASSPVAARAELHTHDMDNGIMRMRPVEAIEVMPGDPTVLQPGGTHIMLMELRQPLTAGSRFPLTLTFAEAGTVTLEVEVMGIGAMGPASAAPAR